MVEETQNRLFSFQREMSSRVAACTGVHQDQARKEEGQRAMRAHPCLVLACLAERGGAGWYVHVHGG
jgi:hypothetical protein